LKKTRPQLLKAGVRQLMAGMYYGTGRFKTRLRGRVVILAYHRVLTQKDLAAHFVQPGMYVLADVFESQMRFVREHFCLLSIGELFQRWKSGGLDERSRYCVITFDDGWLDNYVYAYPVLRRLGIPATIFLPTRFVGTDEWFWPDKLAYLLRCSRPNGTPPGAEGTEWITHVEDVIARWKRMTGAAIETALSEMSRTLGVSVPRERAVVGWEEVAEMARFIKQFLVTGYRSKVNVLYGGSTNQKNIGAFLQESAIDGALVGGASLRPGEFRKMVRIANSIHFKR